MCGLPYAASGPRAIPYSVIPFATGGECFGETLNPMPASVRLNDKALKPSDCWWFIPGTVTAEDFD